MSLFKLNEKKCTRDGACVAACPIHIITIDEKSSLPVMVEGGEKACINCGHCISVCPTGAISLSTMPVDACKALEKDWRIPPEEITQFLKGRRSIRNYKDEPIDRKIIERLIDIARYAPSGINRQPVYWAVIYDKEKIVKLSALVVEWMRKLISEGSELAESLRMKNIIKAYDSGADWICRGAPHAIITYSLKEDMTAPQACTIALTYLELSAASFGLGACWAGYLNMAINMSPEVQRFAGLSKRTSAFGAMLIGHPKFRYYRIPLRNDPHILWR